MKDDAAMSRIGIAFVLFAVIAGFFLLAEHRLSDGG